MKTTSFSSVIFSTCVVTVTFFSTVTVHSAVFPPAEAVIVAWPVASSPTAINTVDFPSALQSAVAVVAPVALNTT